MQKGLESLHTALVRDFQDHIGAPIPVRLDAIEAVIHKTMRSSIRQEHIRATRELHRVANTLATCGEALKTFLGCSGALNDLVLRAQFIVEESAEVIKSMADLDTVALADGLADLQYVTIGTSISTESCIDACFLTVHKSNMTKRAGASTEAGIPGGDRIAGGDKGKGESFMPADIVEALTQGREAALEREISNGK